MYAYSNCLKSDINNRNFIGGKKTKSSFTQMVSFDSAPLIYSRDVHALYYTRIYGWAGGRSRGGGRVSCRSRKTRTFPLNKPLIRGSQCPGGPDQRDPQSMRAARASDASNAKTTGGRRKSRCSIKKLYGFFDVFNFHGIFVMFWVRYMEEIPVESRQFMMLNLVLILMMVQFNWVLIS